MRIIKVKPAEGRRILMPDAGYRPVKDEGETVVATSFYVKAINDGDLVLIEEVEPVSKMSGDKGASPKPSNKMSDPIPLATGK